MDERARDIMRRVGNRIRARRLDRGLSQTELARHIGVTLQQVQKYETAKNRMPVDRLVRVAEVLETPVGYFTDTVTVEPGRETPSTVNRQSMELVRHFQHISNQRVRGAVIGLLRGLDTDTAAQESAPDRNGGDNGDGDAAPSDPSAGV